MRQTLLRILLDEFWSWKWKQNDPSFLGWGDGLYVGVGFLAIPYILYLLVLGIRLHKTLASDPSLEGSSFFQHIPWIAVAIPFLLIFLLAPMIAPNFPQGVPVRGWGVMLFVGFTLSAINATVRAKKLGWSEDLMWSLGMAMLISGVAGARLFHLIQYYDQNFRNTKSLGEMILVAINLGRGGVVLYGGAIAGVIAYLIFCRVHQMNPLQLADVITPSCFIGVGFGRLGCLLNGCCFGNQCELPWKISFPPHSVPYDAFIQKGIILPGIHDVLSLHPTQIYSAINAFMIYLITSAWYKHRTWNGSVFTLALLLYPISRFFIEIIRADEPGRFQTSLTISQWVSIGIFACGLLLFFVQRKKSVSRV